MTLPEKAISIPLKVRILYKFVIVGERCLVVYLKQSDSEGLFMEKILSWDDFEKVEMRVGTVVSAQVFAEARNPSYKLSIDFGDYGIKNSSAQITKKYTAADLIGKQVVAVVNFPTKQIAKMMSECLVLGAVEENNQVTLMVPEGFVKNGTRIL